MSLSFFPVRPTSCKQAARKFFVREKPDYDLRFFFHSFLYRANLLQFFFAYFLSCRIQKPKWLMLQFNPANTVLYYIKCILHIFFCIFLYFSFYLHASCALPPIYWIANAISNVLKEKCKFFFDFFFIFNFEKKKES